MVNDKMVNSFMKKKIYSTPLTEVMNVSTELMQHLSSPSTTEFPGGPAGIVNRRYAPANRTPVF